MDRRTLGIWIFVFSALVAASSPLFDLPIRQIFGLLAILAFWGWSANNVNRFMGSGSPVSLKIPAWAWACLLPVAVGARLLPCFWTHFWPNFDEVQIAQTGIQLSRHWEWKPFYSLGQIPALWNWVAGLLYRFSDDTLFNLWVMPLFFSLATVGLAAWAFLRVFPREVAFTATAMLAVGYWPLLAGGYCVQAVLLPFWECTLFLFWTFERKAEAPRASVVWAGFLGAWTGFGFWTYLAWPTVALCLILALIMIPHSEVKGRSTYVAAWAFGTCLLLSFLPFGAALMEGDPGTHFFHYSILAPWFTIREKVEVVADYFNALFWGYWGVGSIYVPWEGGLLNPLMGLCFLLGLDQGRRSWIPSVRNWLYLSLGLFLLPGILSHSLQVLRVDALIPFTAVLCALGLGRLADFLGKWGKREIWFAALLLLSAGWDSFRWVGKLESEAAGTLACQEAFRILGKVHHDLGAGMIFTEFGLPRHGSDPDFQGLEVMAYPWNLAQNPHLVHGKSAWAAVLTNSNLVPFLRSRMPGAAWQVFPGSGGPEGPLALGLVPVRGPHPSIDWGLWLEADRWFHKITLGTNDIYDPKSYEPVLREILSPDPGLLNDPFLAGCYWACLSDFYYNYDFSEHFEPQLKALQKAVQACPSAQWEYDLGCLLYRKGRYDEARVRLEAAVQAPGAHTAAKEVLGILTLENPKLLAHK